MKNNFTFFFLVITIFTFSQEQKKDSIKRDTLPEIVITAQFSKQSLDKSIYDVTVITAKEIEQSASNNLADLLNQNLNILIVPNASTGKSQVNLFGLDGQYFKILQDGIPIISDDGFGNNIDLTQLNLDNIKQIEIVEGSMGVQYGANAVSGVINLITKKAYHKDLLLSVSMQEETVGNEYELWNQGRHIQTVKLSRNLGENFYTSIHFSRNHFTGFLKDRKGKNYLNSDGLRGYEWLPKEQMSANALFNYKTEKIGILYKLVVFKELLNSYNATLQSYYDTTLQQYEKIANDTDFKTNRISHSLIFDGKIKNKINYTFSTAYQTQYKKLRNYIYNLYDQTSIKENYRDYLYRKTFFTKAVFNDFLKNKNYDFQVGLEFNNENGFGSSETTFTSLTDAKEELTNFDIFTSSEIFLGEKISLKPGVRYSFQSKFDNQLSYSLSSKYKIKPNLELRNVIGTSYRTPNYDELFTYFVHPNHDIYGNENLKNENSFSVETHLKKKTHFKKKKIYLTNKLKMGFINVKDKIELILVDSSPKLLYKYINIDEYKSVNLTSENKIRYKNINFKLGTTVQGVSETINNEILDNKYLYSFQINSNLDYSLNSINTWFSLNYKYNSKQDEFVQSNDQNNNEIIVKSTREAFSWFDASVKKSFYDNNIKITFGARNLFNVTNTTSTVSTSGNLHGTSNTILLGYGRSYFLKLNYNFSI